MTTETEAIATDLSPLPEEDKVPTDSYLPARRVNYTKPLPEDSIPRSGGRGGLRTPLRIVWRPIGRGLFTRVHADGVTALYPFVEWASDSGRVYRTPLREWRVWGTHMEAAP